jgi:hypothetical protein
LSYFGPSKLNLLERVGTEGVFDAFLSSVFVIFSDFLLLPFSILSLRARGGVRSGITFGISHGDLGSFNLLNCTFFASLLANAFLRFST